MYGLAPSRVEGQRGYPVCFRIEFFRIRPSDEAHALLGRVPDDGPDLAGVKKRAKLLFYQLKMPQTPDGLRILNPLGVEVFSWRPNDRRP
jgi:hypothetical protein